MTFIWFLLAMSLLGFAAFAAARWGADSRDEEYSMGRIVAAVRRFNDDQVALRQTWLAHHGIPGARDGR